MALIHMNKLSKRIKTLINECKEAEVWADIGCDHGYVTLELIKQNKAKKVIATDIHAESLGKTKKLLAKHNLQNFADYYVGDGFNAIPENDRIKINSCIIAGMGGNEIMKILSIFKPQKLVLQPMRNEKELRNFLTELYQ